MQAYLKLKDVDEELCKSSAHVKLVAKIKKLFRIITVKNIDLGVIFILPISLQEYYDNYNNNEKNKSLENKYKKHIKKYIAKIIKLIKKYQISSIVISEELKNNKNFMQVFFQDNYIKSKLQILDGRGIMPYIIKEIIEYILVQIEEDRNTKQEDLYILLKEDSSIYRQNISYLSEYFKTINIVTPNILSYQKFANRLEEKQDAIITVSNNKKKSLRRAKFIVNFDIEAEEMKKYIIYRTATIIYLKQGKVYEANGFEGIHICNTEIDTSEDIKDFFEKEHLLKKFKLNDLYESTIINKKFGEIKEKMNKDMLKIEKLYGVRGVITTKEYKKNIN